MENCNNLESLKRLIEEGEKVGLDFSSLEKKINEYINNKDVGTIKIVLLGSFSDGKTTAIAGLLGKLESNMKSMSMQNMTTLTRY